MTQTSNISNTTVLINCLSCSLLLGRARAMLAKVVRRKTASDVNVFINMSVNCALWVESGVWFNKVGGAAKNMIRS